MKAVGCALLLMLTVLVMGAGEVAVTSPSVTPPGTASPWTVFAPIIVAIVPVLVMLLKKKIPVKYAPVLPVIAVLLGPVVDYVLSWLVGKAADPTAGAMYGAMGVALREVVDQVRRADWSPESWTPPGDKASPPPVPPKGT